MTRVPRLVMAGADYRTSALAERERIAFTPGETRALLARARTVEGVREAMVLSTCNRTEFYRLLQKNELTPGHFQADFQAGTGPLSPTGDTPKPLK